MSEAYLEPSQTSKKEYLARVVHVSKNYFQVYKKIHPTCLQFSSFGDEKIWYQETQRNSNK